MIQHQTAMWRYANCFVIATVALMVCPSVITYGEEPTNVSEDLVDYSTLVKPILATKCYACHGALKQKADLRLETRSLMIDGGDNGAVIEPGHASDSLLVERVTADSIEDRMPPEGEGSVLNEDELRLLKLWINQGAVAPEEPVPAAPDEHWSFKRIERPELSAGDDSVHPVDSLFSLRHNELGLKPQPAASRSILLRRLYLDLIGLPPTRSQLKDARPWEEIVEELLANPQHGERWARHWMDVWRYSDWYGLGDQLRFSQKHMWHWRDWIIESLNRDKPYDRMIVEMLAGDEVAPNDFQTLRATGFLARNYYLFNRTTWLDSTIEHTGKAFLGLTINCAKCHDHKYDPISQQDYYSFRAIFEPHQVRLDQLPGESDLDQDGLPRVFDDHLDAETFLHVRGDPKNPDKETVIAPAVPAMFAGFAPSIDPIDLPVFAFAPGTRDYVQQAHLKTATDEVEKALEQFTAAQKELDVASAAGKAKAGEVDVNENPKEPAVDAFLVSDEFDLLDQERWDVVGDGWVCRDGVLSQTVASRDPGFVRLRESMPANFQVTCKYTTTGGTTYKSVSFRFDQSDDLKYDNFVYTSAHAPGQKVQIAYTRDGKSSYPANGLKPAQIVIGTTYELRFAVRDRLVNVWLDGSFMLAYELPDRQPAGSLDLSGFDATVAFDSIRIESLDSRFAMTQPNGVTQDRPDPQRNFELAEKRLAAARAKLTSVKATIAADTARFTEQLPLKDQPRLIKVAARQEAIAMKADAVYELLAATDDAKRKAAEDDVAKADALIKKINAPDASDTTYKSLSGSRKALEGPDHNLDSYDTVYSATSTGRRLALARWIVDRENPLTARVAVNQVWMRHFGEPLVESVFDFGLRAPRPENAELLDWLAVEFIESGWSFKHLHRLIVMSKAYQRSSSIAGADKETIAGDRDNRFYWRMPSRRMESQVVRDSLLSLAGKLDSTIGGASVEANQESLRRSLYFVHSGDEQDKFISMFDDADTLQCYRRSESVVPQQALALSNSKLALTMGTAIAEEISSGDENMSQTDFIRLAFQTLLARMPSDDELLVCNDYCEQLAKLVETDSNQAVIRARLVQSLLNHNDFIAIR